MTGERVIVFGGSGFLGSHVADALVDAGHVVRIFDEKPSPYLRKGQEMVVADMMDLDAVVKASQDCAIAYNFAGMADLDVAKDHPIETARLNILGNMNVLEAARQHGMRRFIYASTVYVYSEAGSFYRASKQSAEHFVEAYHEKYALDYTILRYGSLYGRRSGKNNAIYRFLKEALEKKSITYTGDGEAIREYIHVSDAARLSVRILDAPYANKHILLTGLERWKVKDLMQMIAEMLKRHRGDVKLNYGNGNVEGHYVMTPYAFNPRVGQKLVSNDYLDLGQGLLDLLGEIEEKK